MSRYESPSDDLELPRRRSIIPDNPYVDISLLICRRTQGMDISVLEDLDEPGTTESYSAQ